MSDSTAHSPEEWERPMLHANEHSPIKWPVHSPVSYLTSHTFLPSPCSPLSSAWHIHRETCRPPLHSEGEFYLTGRKNSPRVRVEALSQKCQRETENPITPTVSTVMVGCISCCLHYVHRWTLLFCLSVCVFITGGGHKHMISCSIDITLLIFIPFCGVAAACVIV